MKRVGVVISALAIACAIACIGLGVHGTLAAVSQSSAQHIAGAPPPGNDDFKIAGAPPPGNDDFKIAGAPPPGNDDLRLA